MKKKYVEKEQEQREQTLKAKKRHSQSGGRESRKEKVEKKN